MTDFPRLAESYIAMWNATDPNVRQDLLHAVCADSVRYVDPLADVSGADALDAAIAGVQGQFPAFRFSLSEPVDAHHNQARFSWELGPDGTDGAAPVAGFDVITTDENGRITLVLGFLDRVPS